MKLILINRERLVSVGQFLVDEFDSLLARIRGSWQVEHTEDDKHGNVHATTVATGRLAFSTIEEITWNQAQVDNFSSGTLGAAAILRIFGTGNGGNSPMVLLTGIQLPQDEAGAVIDGRVLVLENSTDATFVALSHEDTHSTPQNRFSLPFPGDDAETKQVVLAPKSMLVVIYDHKAARWRVIGQSNDAIIASVSDATTGSIDYAPAGFQSCRTLLVNKTAAGCNIAGFNSANIASYARKTVQNIGLYSFDILHANVGATEVNRVFVPGQTRYRLHPREAVDLVKIPDSGWRLVVSEKADQWMDVTFAAGNFTTDVGTWTVGSSDQITYAYQIDGCMMTISFDIRTSTAATNPTQLRIAVPGGRIIARTMQNRIIGASNGTELTTAFVQASAGNTFLQCLRDVAGTAWTGTDNIRVSGQITFMVREDSSIISEPHTDVAHADAAHSDVAHSDVAHSDVAHGDSHSDASHSDTAHSDVAHTDGSSHSDTHSDVAHSDTAHSDTVHSDTHGDIEHEDHTDETHNDGGTHLDSHTDFHFDTAHADTAHSDTAHSDSHSDTSSHSDVAHQDVAHVDGGHSDSHSDTVPHSDVTHVDVAHGDTAHGDTEHSDIGMHFDTSHVDI